MILDGNKDIVIVHTSDSFAGSRSLSRRLRLWSDLAIWSLVLSMPGVWLNPPCDMPRGRTGLPSTTGMIRQHLTQNCLCPSCPCFQFETIWKPQFFFSQTKLGIRGKATMYLTLSEKLGEGSSRIIQNHPESNFFENWPRSFEKNPQFIEAPRPLPAASDGARPRHRRVGGRRVKRRANEHCWWTFGECGKPNHVGI